MTAKVSKIVDMIARGARRADAAVVGPVVWYPARPEWPGADDRVWSTIVSVSHDGRSGPEFHCHSVVFGITAAELPQSMMAAADVVLTVRRSNECTYEEARAMRDRLTHKLRQRFTEVFVFETEIDAARFCAKRWPGEEINLVLANVIAKQEQSVSDC